MYIENLKGALEAILFANGDPVQPEQIMSILPIDQEDLEDLLVELARDFEERQSGLQLQRIAGGYQLVTRPEFYVYVEKLAQVVDRKLSAPAMETLSIIAFKQPVTKQEIEQIRGVRTERIIAKLLEQDLICEVGRKETIGRPIVYGTTATFLKCFGLNDIRELPELPETDKLTNIEQLELPADAACDMMQDK